MNASDMSAPPDDIGSGQRAFWTFLFYTLCGPFFAALAYAVVMLLAPALQLDAVLPVGLPPLAEAVPAVFVWSALPAALAAVVLIPMVWRRGYFGWIEAAAAGVVAFAAATVLAPFEHYGALTVLAFLAGLVAVAVRHVLLLANILSPPDKA